MAANIKLRYRGEGDTWQEVELSSAEYIIGRGIDCDLVLDQLEVSRYHARITREEGGFRLTDLDSSNGTTVDGQPLVANTPVTLNPGQTIRLVDSRWRLKVQQRVNPPLSSKESSQQGRNYFYAIVIKMGNGRHTM